jgi:hypothetical protein
MGTVMVCALSVDMENKGYVMYTYPNSNALPKQITGHLSIVLCYIYIYIYISSAVATADVTNIQ